MVIALELVQLEDVAITTDIIAVTSKIAKFQIFCS